MNSNLLSLKKLTALILLVSTAWGCTFAQTTSVGNRKTSLASTVGVSTIILCRGDQAKVTFVEHEEKESTWKRVVFENCDEITRSESNGFTGWDVIDAAITGFLGWITFGAITI